MDRRNFIGGMLALLFVPTMKSKTKLAKSIGFKMEYEPCYAAYTIPNCTRIPDKAIFGDPRYFAMRNGLLADVTDETDPNTQYHIKDGRIQPITEED